MLDELKLNRIKEVDATGKLVWYETDDSLNFTLDNSSPDCSVEIEGFFGNVLEVLLPPDSSCAVIGWLSVSLDERVLDMVEICRTSSVSVDIAPVWCVGLNDILLVVANDDVSVLSGVPVKLETGTVYEVSDVSMEDEVEIPVEIGYVFCVLVDDKTTSVLAVMFQYVNDLEDDDLPLEVT